MPISSAWWISPTDDIIDVPEEAGGHLDYVPVPFASIKEVEQMGWVGARYHAPGRVLHVAGPRKRVLGLTEVMRTLVADTNPKEILIELKDDVEGFTGDLISVSPEELYEDSIPKLAHRHRMMTAPRRRPKVGPPLKAAKVHVREHLKHPPGSCLCHQSKTVDRVRRGLVRRLK